MREIEYLEAGVDISKKISDYGKDEQHPNRISCSWASSLDSVDFACYAPGRRCRLPSPHLLISVFSSQAVWVKKRIGRSGKAGSETPLIGQVRQRNWSKDLP